jgi:hypothetical protein
VECVEWLSFCGSPSTYVGFRVCTVPWTEQMLAPMVCLRLTSIWSLITLLSIHNTLFRVPVTLVDVSDITRLTRQTVQHGGPRTGKQSDNHHTNGRHREHNRFFFDRLQQHHHPNIPRILHPNNPPNHFLHFQVSSGLRYTNIFSIALPLALPLALSEHLHQCLNDLFLLTRNIQPHLPPHPRRHRSKPGRGPREVGP